MRAQRPALRLQPATRRRCVKLAFEPHEPAAAPSVIVSHAGEALARLDLSSEYSGLFTPGIESIDFASDQLERFNALARSLNDGFRELTAEQIAGVARRVLRAATAGAQSPFIPSRVRRAEEMRLVVGDPDWQPPDLVAHRIAGLLAYLDDPDDLIRDAIPVIGRLDDALLVDVAMDTLREELDDYADFRRYRVAERARCADSGDAMTIDRTRWLQARADEVRLEKQRRRVRTNDYAASLSDRIFHVW